MEPASSSPQISYFRLAAVIFLSIATGMPLGVYFYRHWVFDQRALSEARRDVSRSASPSSQLPQTVPSDQPPTSSIDMVRSGPMGAPMAGAPTGQPAQAVTSLIRTNESRYEKLAIEYSRKYPVIRQYGRDWAG